MLCEQAKDQRRLKILLKYLSIRFPLFVVSGEMEYMSLSVFTLLFHALGFSADPHLHGLTDRGSPAEPVSVWPSLRCPTQGTKLSSRGTGGRLPFTHSAFLSDTFSASHCSSH